MRKSRADSIKSKWEGSKTYEKNRERERERPRDRKRERERESRGTAPGWNGQGSSLKHSQTEGGTRCTTAWQTHDLGCPWAAMQAHHDNGVRQWDCFVCDQGTHINFVCFQKWHALIEQTFDRLGIDSKHSPCIFRNPVNHVTPRWCVVVREDEHQVLVLKTLRDG